MQFHFNLCSQGVDQMELKEIIPVLDRVVKAEKDKKQIAQLEEIKKALQDSLEDFDLVQANAREYANFNMKQRDAMHDLIKEYAKRIPDSELANNLLKEANRVIKNV